MTATAATETERFKKRITLERDRLDTVSAWHLKVHEATGLELPYSPDAQWIYVNVSEWNSEEQKYDYDKDKSLQNIAKIAKFAAREPGVGVKKNYQFEDFELICTIPSSKDDTVTHEVYYKAKRELICTKKVVGTEEVPEKVIPARTKEIVEWECEPTSLLAIPTES